VLGPDFDKNPIAQQVALARRLMLAGDPQGSVLFEQTLVEVAAMADPLPRAQALIELARCHYDKGQSSRCYADAAAARDLAREHDWDYGQLEGLRLMSLAAQTVGDLGHALALAQQMLDKRGGSADPKQAWRVHTKLGSLLLASRRYAEGLHELRQAMIAGEAASPGMRRAATSNLVWALHRMANESTSRGEVQEAQGLRQEALALVPQIQTDSVREDDIDFGLIGGYLYVSGSVRLACGETGSHEILAQFALARRRKDRSLRASAFELLATQREQRGWIRRALALTLRAVRDGEAARDEEEQLRCIGMLARRQAACGLYGDAHRTLQRLLREQRRHAHTEGQAAVAAVRWNLDQQRERSQVLMARAEKLTTLGRLATGLMHDMAHPVGAIMLAADTAQAVLAKGRTEGLSKLYAGVAHEVERLRAQLLPLENFGQLRPLRVAQGDLRGAVDAALRLCMPRLSVESVAHSVAVPSIGVRADLDRLELAIANVIFNALDALEGRERKHVELSASTAEGWARLVIRDNGPGLSETAQAHLFEPFFTTKAPGLGLLISAESLASMGGTMAGANHAGGGAEFVLTLPLA